VVQHYQHMVYTVCHRVLRNVQDGQVQVYLLLAVVSVTVWLLLKALPLILTLV
jgi:hypothetical protein